VKAIAVDAESPCAQSNLVEGFLAGRQQAAPSSCSQPIHQLEYEGGFADAGIAGEQHNGTGHESAAQHAIRLTDAGRYTHHALVRDRE
jgi:hypothetical protein